MAVLPSLVPALRFSSAVIYEPLDVKSEQPSIRLAILQPASREATIRIELAHATFASRPKYEALSYTWGKPDQVKGIEINGYPVEIRENLWEALVNLRDPQEEGVLWIDAICINQADVDERNRQVQLMAYIYSRAKVVIVWLGTLEDQYLVSQYTQQHGALALKQDGVKELCNHPYWRRVWIVQEIGAATRLQVRWGTHSDSWEAFFQYAKPRSVESEIGAALKLFQSREDRHGDSFLLANLMEACKDSLCEEPRDKVYGYLGIAHDCQDGSLPVDYSKSLFELYEDVVQFYYRKKVHRAHFTVYFSQLVQKLLGGRKAMLDDVYITRPGQTIPLTTFLSLEDTAKILILTGEFVGIISTIGPSYEAIVGIPEATRSWKVVLSKRVTNQEKLRKKRGGFLRVLLELGSADLDKIHPIDSQFSRRCDRRMAGHARRFTQSVAWDEWDSSPGFKLGSESEDLDHGISQSPHLFTTISGDIGLVPHNSRLGDLLVSFWHSDVVAVVRVYENFQMRIVGRAVIANEEYMESRKFLVRNASRVVYDSSEQRDLYVDICTLQQLTQ